MHPSVMLGLTTYGPQDQSWWKHLLAFVISCQGNDIDLLNISVASGMAIDHNRNQVADEFLRSDAEWLFWMDADNVYPLGALPRLLATEKKLVTGIYFTKEENPHPVVYNRVISGQYKAIEDWNRGELLPIDMAGMGMCLTHRSVFEDIKKNYTVVQRSTGSITLIHNSDIHGKLEKTCKHTDFVVQHGRLTVNVQQPDFDYHFFPFFNLEYLRTEDVGFFEIARRSGHQAYCDTSVVTEHLWTRGVTQADYARGLKVKRTELKRDNFVYTGELLTINPKEIA